MINSAAEVVNKGGAPSTSSTAPVGVAPDVSVTSAAAPPATPTVVFQPTGETALSQAGVSRLDASAHVIERMLNQNTYDDIAQGKTNVKRCKRQNSCKTDLKNRFQVLGRRCG